MEAPIFFLLKGVDLEDKPLEIGNYTRNNRTNSQRGTLSKEILLNQRLHFDPRMVWVPTLKQLDKDGEEYPERTKLYCGYDHYPFDEPPLGLPVSRTKGKLIKGQRVDVYYCDGMMFCSFSCAYSYWLANYANNPTSKYRNSVRLLQELQNEVHKLLGKPYTTLKEAHDWRMLKTIGCGDMSIDVFRSNNTEKYVRSPNIVMHKATVLHNRYA